jgi:rhodanese-related sulfurtransferase
MEKLFLIILFVACVDQQPKIQILEKHEFQDLMNQDVQLIDVRTSEEYNNGFIKEAQNIDYNSFDFINQISKLDKSKPVLLYCAMGGRSYEASKVFKSLGFKKIYDLKGGFSSW